MVLLLFFRDLFLLLPLLPLLLIDETDGLRPCSCCVGVGAEYVESSGGCLESRAALANKDSPVEAWTDGGGAGGCG